MHAYVYMCVSVSLITDMVENFISDDRLVLRYPDNCYKVLEEDYMTIIIKLQQPKIGSDKNNFY